jgi:hypothetical protein
LSTAPIVVIEPDSDGDGVPNSSDAFPNDPNEWADSDGDEIGDNSDLFPYDADNDIDGDGLRANEDNCPLVANADQADLDGDNVGDACDSDFDGDGFDNDNDAFPTDDSEWADSDGDEIGDNADPFIHPIQRQYLLAIVTRVLATKKWHLVRTSATLSLSLVTQLLTVTTWERFLHLLTSGRRMGWFRAVTRAR